MGLILPIVTAAAGVAGNIYGQIQANKAAKRAENYNAQRMNDVSAWFNKEYYGDYLNSLGGRSALARLDTQFKDTQKGLQNNAIAGGATPEAVIAGAGQVNKSYGDAINGLLGQGDIAKQRAMYSYQGLMQPLQTNQANMLAGKVNQWNQFGKNISGATSGILDAWANGSFDKQ